MIFISDNEKKSEEMIRYEKETGKYAIWRGVVTEGFKRWKKGEKIYIKDKERLNVLISKEKKTQWENYAKENKITTISKLIRRAVDFYIEITPKLSELNNFNRYSHDLKQELSSIMGFSQILIEEYKDELSWDFLLKIKEIYDKSVNIEKIIQNILNIRKDKQVLSQYDILLIDDDDSTIHLLSEFFKKKGYLCKDVSTGTEAIEILKYSVPKLVLLDILLPDSNGYDVCKTIKSDNRLKDVPVFYITAITESDINEKMKGTGAEGFFLKPFNMKKFNILFNYL